MDEETPTRNMTFAPPSFEENRVEIVLVGMSRTGLDSDGAVDQDR